MDECLAEIDFVITHPKGYELATSFRKRLGLKWIRGKALEDADFVYVKNWSSYKKYGKILNSDPSWMITTRITIH